MTKLEAPETWLEFSDSNDASRRIFVDTHVARLLFDLANSGPIPRRHSNRLGTALGPAIAGLVCDGLVDIEGGGGQFVHGAEAAAELFGDRILGAATPRRGNTVNLSLAAISHGLQLRQLGASRLARRLYQFNAIPRTSYWERRLPTQYHVAHWLALDFDSEWKTILGRKYKRLESSKSARHWTTWQHCNRINFNDARYKIYVSPDPRALPDVFQITVRTACAMDVPCLKIGSSVQDILRPDKLVLYLDTLDDVKRIAAELEPEIGGAASQGVPFTSELVPSGLISWAIDPPTEKETDLLGRYSWRTLVSECLARALVNTPAHVPHAEGVDFALKRLQLEGVDPDTWEATIQ